MDGFLDPKQVIWPAYGSSGRANKLRRWVSHSAHTALASPHRQMRPRTVSSEEPLLMSASALGHSEGQVVLDGSRGEGGGQILRTALTLSLLTGRPFRISKIRAYRPKPGLRPQHLKAVEASAELSGADVTGAAVGGARTDILPHPYAPRDLSIDIGTAGSTGLVLQTLHLPMALNAEQPVRLMLSGGTFNPKAPPFPFLEFTWRAFLAAIGMPLALSLPAAGFYPRGGGRLDAWIEPATPCPFVRTKRGSLQRLHGIAGIANLRDDIAERMRYRAIELLSGQGITTEIDLVRWPSPGQGAAISLTAEYEGMIPATFVSLGERGRPAEAVADDAVDQWLAFDAVEHAAVDPYSADQLLLPLAFASGVVNSR